MTKRGNRVLFVYGSLKRGGRHHAELRGARFLGEAVTARGYALEELGEYLALVPRPEALGAVAGELFEVDDALLALLDEFEGPDYERRDLEAVEVRAGKASEASDTSHASHASDTSHASHASDTSHASHASDTRPKSPEKRLPLAYLRRTR